MQKKAQSAMEFLTTYGWALLIAIVVIGALVYFGVLNPSLFISDRCNFPGQVKCSSFSTLTTVHGSIVNMSISNLLGKRIVVLNSTVSGDKDTPNAVCWANIIPGNQAINPGEANWVGALNCNASGTTAVSRGDVVDLIFTINYVIPGENNFRGTATGYLHYRAP